METTIYRVETSWGDGVYADPYLVSMMVIEEDNEAQHLPPWLDKGLKSRWEYLVDKSKYYFGFDSKEQFLDWFDKPSGREEASRTEVGYLAIYTVPSDFVIVGDKQTIFVKSEATLVSKERLDYFD